MMSIQISKSQFKAKALEIFRTIERTGDSVIVTDHGRPVLEVRPYISKKGNPLDRLRGSVIEYQHPTEPVAEEDWATLS